MNFSVETVRVIKPLKVVGVLKGIVLAVVKMDEKNLNRPSKNDSVTELENQVEALSVKEEICDSEQSESRKSSAVHSEFLNLPNIDEKLTEVQCPFTWCLPHTGIIPPEKVLTLIVQDKDEFDIRKVMHDILQVYELYNDDKLDEANDKLTTVLDYVQDLYNSCKDELFAKMKKPLEHLMQSCKAHLLKAYFSKFSPHKEQHLQELIKVLETVHPYSEMTENEQACMYIFKAQAFLEYGHSGRVESLEIMKKAIKLDPKEPEWYFLAGKLMARIRRCTNWNIYVEQEEIKLLELAVELCEKPSYLVCLANSYVDYTRGISKNMQVDREMKKLLHKMNNQAKELFMKSIQLKPNCAYLNIRCANGLLKMPKYFRDMDVMKKCISVALEKAPNNGFVNHVAGMFAEREEYNTEKALYYYKICSNLSVYGGMAKYIKLKYMYDKDYDLIGALEKMLECCETLTNRHRTLSDIGAYYLFLERDLFRALQYYGRIMNEDSSSSAITAHMPAFLHILSLNMYEILCIEVHSELNKNKLSSEETNILMEFLNKLNQIDPLILEKCVDQPSQLQKIMVESRMSEANYKANVRTHSGIYYNDVGVSVNTERGSEQGEARI